MGQQQLKVGIFSGGDISPDGSFLLLKRHNLVYLYAWDPSNFSSMEYACRINLYDYVGPTGFHVGAVAFDGPRSFLSLEEMQHSPIFRVKFQNR